MTAPDQRADSRHIPTTQITITCKPARRARWFKRKSRPVAAMVLEVSANGMLMELPLEMNAYPGLVVELSSDTNNDAVARVVHIVRDENWAHQWVGVELTEMSPEFAASLNLLVTSLGIENASDSGEPARTVGSVTTGVASKLLQRRRNR